jgi:hypothetical protein
VDCSSAHVDSDGLDWNCLDGNQACATCDRRRSIAAARCIFLIALMVRWQMEAVRKNRFLFTPPAKRN